MTEYVTLLLLTLDWLRQTAVTAHLKSDQLQLAAFAGLSCR